jgi:hypothetical protein
MSHGNPCTINPFLIFHRSAHQNSIAHNLLWLLLLLSFLLLTLSSQQKLNGVLESCSSYSHVAVMPGQRCERRSHWENWSSLSYSTRMSSALLGVWVSQGFSATSSNPWPTRDSPFTTVYDLTMPSICSHLGHLRSFNFTLMLNIQLFRFIHSPLHWYTTSLWFTCLAHL